MAASTPNPDSPTNTDDRYRLARVAPGTGERLPLTGDYLELVWSELLGPTATMVARRIGRALDEPGRVRRELSLTTVGNSLGVAPSKVRWSLTRLAYFELITIASNPATVVTSGLVTPLPPSLLPKLSPVGLEQHRQLLCSGPAQRRSEVSPIGPSAPAMRQRGRAL